MYSRPPGSPYLYPRSLHTTVPSKSKSMAVPPISNLQLAHGGSRKEAPHPPRLPMHANARVSTHSLVPKSHTPPKNVLRDPPTVASRKPSRSPLRVLDDITTPGVRDNDVESEMVVRLHSSAAFLSFDPKGESEIEVESHHLIYDLTPGTGRVEEGKGCRKIPNETPGFPSKRRMSQFRSFNECAYYTNGGARPPRWKMETDVAGYRTGRSMRAVNPARTNNSPGVNTLRTPA